MRRSGDTIRITAQLIEVESDVHIWSETWDRTFADIFVIQDEIAAAVVNALKIRLLGDTPRSHVTVPEAYALYLQSEQLSNLLTEESMQQAEALLVRALEIDEQFAPGWARLSQVCGIGSGTGTWPPVEGAALSRSAAEKALGIDDGNVQAHLILSRIARHNEYDPEVADRELDLAVSLAPNDSGVLRMLAQRFTRQGNYEKAISYLEQAALMDPLNPLTKRTLAFSYFEAGDNNAAVSVAKEGLALNPAAVHAYRGELHEAFAWLDRAIARRDQSLRRIQRDPFMTSLYDDPRYEPLLDRLGQKRVVGH